MRPEEYFSKPQTIAQKHYEALRLFFVDNLPAKIVAEKFGFKLRAFQSLVSDFRKIMKEADQADDPFFKIPKKGRKFKQDTDKLTELIVDMRKKNYSVGDIKTVLDSQGKTVSEKYVYLVLNKQGFSRLPRRSKKYKKELEQPNLEAEKTTPLIFSPETFHTNAAGLLLFLPYIESSGIKEAITQSDYPETNTINKLSSILSFLALKLSSIRRYSADDLWCMDRGSGLFASLNILPKTGWYTSYSHRVTASMNKKFLNILYQIWKAKGLINDTVNLDFVTVPYWGDNSHLENNWSGKRGKALSSMLSVIAQDPDSGIIMYGDTDVKHVNESDVILEFLDFYQNNNSNSGDLKFLVFDSKFTTYENLRRLNDKGIKFITIRRRGKALVDQINNLPKSSWKKIRIMKPDGKGRTLNVNDQTTFLKGYNTQIRQIAITGHGKIKPALIITNEFDLDTQSLIKKYSRRWLVEKAIAEQTDFFHLNRVSSSMVIKVDFDLTMSILAHNIYRLFAMDLGRYNHLSDIRIFEKFIANSGEVEIGKNNIIVKLKKKRELPKILETMTKYKKLKIDSLNDSTIEFSGLTYS